MSFPKQTIRDLPLHGTTVLLRADYNVPQKADGSIADDYRIRQSLPTLQYLIERECKIVICSHLGRPEGKPDKRFTLEPVAQHLADLIKQQVHFIPDCVGDRVSQILKHLPAGSVSLLENLRYYPDEEANADDFARQLAAASGATYFIQDGFGVVHRAHASTDAITRVLPSAAGLLLQKEYAHLVAVRDNPQRPLVAVMGGAKISDKIKVVVDFVQKADKVIIGGAMANNFLRWEGYNVGKSKVEDDIDEVIERIASLVCSDTHDHKTCLRRSDKLILPVDVTTAKTMDKDAPWEHKKIEDIRDNDIILDIGNATVELMKTHLEGARTVLWNGTLGYAEIPHFAHGSAWLALWLAQHKSETNSVIGGGDTADFALHWDKAHGESFGHISTGGGAGLELLAGKKLPGIEALMDKK